MSRKPTNNFFETGKLSFVMDGAAGSSGKSLISSYLVKHADNVDFLVSAFTPNASHTVCDDEGNEFVFKIFCGGSQYHEKLGAVYIADNAAIELDQLWEEIKYLGIPRSKVRISPRCAIVQQIDKDFEAGLCDLDGKYYDEQGDGTVATGSTCSGSGTVIAKKCVRNKTLVTAKDIDQLSEMIYPMSEIVDRLENGEIGLMEIAQGYPLSVNHHQFAPYTTSRNVTVGNALNDAMIPPKYAGNLLLNWRTHPIKIHNKKYKCLETGRFLNWDEVQSGSTPYEEIQSYSGDFYDDQEELTWEEITERSGSETPLMECTTLTKLPRRIATFSRQNLVEAIKFNNTGGKIWLCVNFCNYVTAEVYGERFFEEVTDDHHLRAIHGWAEDNIISVLDSEPSFTNVSIKYLGTGPKIEDRIEVDW